MLCWVPGPEKVLPLPVFGGAQGATTVCQRQGLHIGPGRLGVPVRSHKDKTEGFT